MQPGRSFLTGLAIALTAAGCGGDSATQPAPARVTISLDRVEYRQGDTVYYTAHAAAGGEIVTNTCHGALETRAASGWTRVQSGGEQTNCAVFHIRSAFDGGGTAGIIPTSAPVGTYRYVLDWMAVGSEASVLSEEERRTPTFSVVAR